MTDMEVAVAESVFEKLIDFGASAWWSMVRRPQWTGGA